MALTKEAQRRSDIHRLRQIMSKALYDASGTTTVEIGAMMARINKLQADINEMDDQIRRAETMHHKILETKARAIGFFHIEKFALMQFNMGNMLTLTQAIEMFDETVESSKAVLGAGALEDA